MASRLNLLLRLMLLTFVRLDHLTSWTDQWPVYSDWYEPLVCLVVSKPADLSRFSLRAKVEFRCSSRV